MKTRPSAIAGLLISLVLLVAVVPGDGRSTAAHISTAFPQTYSLTSSLDTNIVSNGSFEIPDIGTSAGVTYSAGQTFGNWTIDSASVDLIKGWQAADGLQSIDLSGLDAGSIHQDLP